MGRQGETSQTGVISPSDGRSSIHIHGCAPESWKPICSSSDPFTLPSFYNAVMMGYGWVDFDR